MQASGPFVASLYSYVCYVLSVSIECVKEFSYSVVIYKGGAIASVLMRIKNA